MLKLKLQYFGHLMRRANSLEKTLVLGTIEGGRRRDDRGWDRWEASLTESTWVWVSSGSWWWTRRPSMWQSMGLQRVRQNWVTELNWTELKVLPWDMLKGNTDVLLDINFKALSYLCDSLVVVVELVAVACQGPLSMRFSRQEYWRGSWFLSPEDLHDPGIKTTSPALQADSLPSELQGSPRF